jgi:hypothetical protein
LITIGVPSALGQCSSFYWFHWEVVVGEWRNISLHASSSSSSSFSSFSSSSVDTVALNQVLTRNFTVSPPTVIPAVYFTAGVSYSFQVQVSLCNFLGPCGHSGGSVVAVTQTLVPTVTIDGSAERNILISQKIALSSTAFVANCNVNPSSLGINYVWKVMNSDLQCFIDFQRSFSVYTSRFLIRSK